MTEIDAGQAIYVLGDTGTAKLMEMLEDKARENGSVIKHTFAFSPGEAHRTDDLSQIDEVVEALEWAIATHTDLWVPFWQQDLGREQHLRALSLTLTRRGRELRLGPGLEVYRGLTPLDAAICGEVWNVLNLDAAVKAAIGMQVLENEVDAFILDAAPKPESSSDEEPCERQFSTAQAAALLGKTRDWLLRGLRAKSFVDRDGSPVEALRAGKGNRLALTGSMLQTIAWSAFLRGAVDYERVQEVFAEVARNER